MALVTVFDRTGRAYALIQPGRRSDSWCTVLDEVIGDSLSLSLSNGLMSLQIIGEMPLTSELVSLLKRSHRLAISYSSARYVDTCLCAAPLARYLTLDTCELDGTLINAARVADLRLRACSGTASVLGIMPLSLTLQMPVLERVGDHIHHRCVQYFILGEPDDNSEGYTLGKLPQDLSIGPNARFCQIEDLAITPEQVVLLAASGLEKLVFSGCLELGGVRPDPIPAIPGTLKEISLDINCANQELLAHIISSSAELRRIRPYSLNLSQEVLTAISALRNVEYLDLFECDTVDFGRLRFPYVRGVRIGWELARRQKRSFASKFPNAEVHIV